MIAYIFWHKPRQGVDPAAYEEASARFHRSLRHAPPAGFRRSGLLAVDDPPWLSGPGWYEDWYLVEDFCALGVLNEAAVAAGHRSSHDQVASRLHSGAGAVYRLLEGCEDPISPAQAIWVSRPAGAGALPLGDMLGDGMDRERASLWRRQMVLGPAPEYCLLANEPPRGVSATRLPQGWQTTTLERKVIFDG